MCPGLTSPGAKLYPAAVDTVVVSFPGKMYSLYSYYWNIYHPERTSDVLFWRLLLLLSFAFLVIFL